MGTLKRWSLVSTINYRRGNGFPMQASFFSARVQTIQAGNMRIGVNAD